MTPLIAGVLEVLSTRDAESEVILPFRAARDQIDDARFFRSTWLASSLITMRSRGDYERYLAFLEPEYRAEITNATPGQWLPVEVAIAHYRACGQLELTDAEIAARSLEVTKRVHDTSLALAVRLAREVGVTPWTIYRQLDRLWHRVWQGGGVSVTKLGPKEATIEVVRWRCAAVPYCRTAMPTVVLAVTQMFCRRAYVKDVTRERRDTSLRLLCSWV